MKNTARRFASGAIAATMAVAAIAAEPRQTTGERDRAAGPIVDFLAVSAAGLPVTGLSVPEIEIRVDGRARRVRALRAVVAAPLRSDVPRPAELSAPYGTNGGRNTGRTFVLVVDEESFLPGSETPLRNAADGLLTQLIQSDRVMLVSVPYRGERLALTREHARLHTAMAGITGQGLRDESGSAMACRTRLVLQSLGGVLERFAGTPDPVTVILFTAGLAGPRRDAPMSMAPGMCELTAPDFQRVGAGAGAARANFYIVQPDNVAMNAGARTEGIGGGGFTGSDNPLEGIEHLSGVTGALRVPLIGQGNAALTRVANESSSYYEAELEPERADTNGRTKPLTVRVNRQGVTVRARPEITFAVPVAAVPAARVTAAEMLLMTEGFPDLPVRAAAFTMDRAADGRLKIVFVADVLDRTVPIESAGAALVDGGGRVVARWSASDPGESPLTGAMLAPPGAYRLRVAVVDANGRTGAADHEFDAQLVPVGPLQLGSIVMGLSRDGALVPRLEFGNEPSALASFEITGGAAGMALVATLEVARTANGPVLVAVPLVINSLGEQRFLATGTVPLGALPVGDYVVTGTITLADGTSGRVLRTLRKR